LKFACPFGGRKNARHSPDCLSQAVHKEQDRLEPCLSDSGGVTPSAALKKQRALLLGHKWQSANYTSVTAIYTRYLSCLTGLDCFAKSIPMVVIFMSDNSFLFSDRIIKAKSERSAFAVQPLLFIRIAE
jgi:hypothetical protein